MLPILAGLGFIAGLLAYSARKGGVAARRVADERRKLAELRVRPRLTLDEAEDGLVLARKFGDNVAVGRFGREIAKLRATRPPI